MAEDKQGSLQDYLTVRTDRERLFEQKHQEELGVKRYAYLQARDFFVPLIAAGAGAGLGWLVHKPIAKLMPKFDKLTSNANKLVDKTIDRYIRHIRRDKNLSQETIDDLVKQLEGQKGQNNIEAVNDLLKQHDIDALGTLGKLYEDTVFWVSIGAGAFLGLLSSGMALGYDQWRKEESTRVAAREINNDISKMRILEPTDNELVAENKRLRQMLNEQDVGERIPTKVQANTVEREALQAAQEAQLSV